MTSTSETDNAARFGTIFAAIVDNIASAVFGKRDSIQLAVISLIAEGHLLIEDVPGVGKTSLAKALARSVDASWSRVQFTPDLLPSDLVGVSIYQRSTEEFRFQAGPIFANIVLADEINRASPKTQSALLEAMEERQVTADGESRRLPPPFMVIATQNPVEQEGTYQLPESQLDRFMMRIGLGYPNREAELRILDGSDSNTPVEIEPVVSPKELIAMSRYARRIYLAPVLKNYLVDITHATRNHPALSLGLSPRATLQLSNAVKTHAAASGRTFGVPDDVHAVAHAVLAHRVLLAPGITATASTGEVIDDIIDAVPVPTLT